MIPAKQTITILRQANKYAAAASAHRTNVAQEDNPTKSRADAAIASKQSHNIPIELASNHQTENPYGFL